MKLKLNSFSVFYCSCVLLFSCAKKEEQKITQQQEITENETEQSADKVNRSIANYWDHYNFADTNAIKDPAQAEQALVDFIALFPDADQKQISQSINAMFEKASVNKEVFSFFKDGYEKYLYDPNSPLHNDVYFLPVLEYLVNTKHLNDTEKIRYRMLLKLVNKNMPGSVATDFEFIDSSGKDQNLHQIKAPEKLLVFYDPECSHCAEAIKQMSQDVRINTLINQEKLKVVAVSPVEDINKWKAYQANIPTKWINGFDKKGDLKQKELYDIKAFPTIYLLDEKNEVVLKDTSLEQVLSLLKI
ncbi:DUF5106 domain-containing protein [Elizabethkingia occulta]|uniref:DUF5106 domain-containing protein n=1 Tax=Elizabethkingia occulta TaxID=1867263 RepID=A0A1T3MA43_9FLAO|nr:DUF5106 domain-containing protein [Elizabethkingia occulta]OPB92385.1 DUF5106 domain-containing protein [Elizabethkingia occulta]OPC61512.1 DUF5106 domain-containing protein [Elizabethkingia occulta]